MKLLVSHSADVKCKDKCGYTPLHAAAASGQFNVVKYLLRLVVEVMLLGHWSPCISCTVCSAMENITRWAWSCCRGFVKRVFLCFKVRIKISGNILLNYSPKTHQLYKWFDIRLGISNMVSCRASRFGFILILVFVTNYAAASSLMCNQLFADDTRVI